MCPRGSLIPSFRRNSTVSACLRKQQSLLLSLTHILLHSHSIFLDLEALFLYRHHILLFPREVCVHFINENELNSILTIWGIFHYAAREARRWPESRVRKPGSPLLPLCCFTLCGAFVTVEGTWSQVGGGLEGKPIVVTRGRNLFLYPSRSWKQLRRPGRQVLSGGTPSSQAVPAFREECVQEGQWCPDGTADGLLGSDSDSPSKGEKGSSFPRRRVAELFRRRLCGAVCTRSHAVGAGSPRHLPALAALSLERLPFSRRGSWSSRGLAFPEPHCSVRGRGGM